MVSNRHSLLTGHRTRKQMKQVIMLKLKIFKDLNSFVHKITELTKKNTMDSKEHLLVKTQNLYIV